MKKLFLLALLHIIWCSAGYTQTSNGIFTRIRAEEYLRIGSNSTQKITGFDLTIPSTATYDKVPTTKAVKDWATSNFALSSGPFLAANGSSSAPSYSFANATGTGLYRTTSDLKLITANNASGEANNINIQAGSSGSGFGGGVSLRSGDAVDDTGGSFQMTSGIGVNGGNFDLTSGEGLVGNGGNFSLVSGVGGTAGNGGFFTMASGGGLNGGDFFLNAGEGTSDGGQGGNLTISAGLASGENEAFGGSLVITGGNATTLSGNAGSVSIKGGASSGGATAGLLELEGGQSNTSGDAVGGEVILKGGIGIRRAPVKVVASPFVFASFTTTERNALTGLENGTVIYNSTTNKLQVRAAAAWVDLH